MDVLMTLLYCIFSCLQIYILMSIGYLCEIKKNIKTSNKSSNNKHIIKFNNSIIFHNPIIKSSRYGNNGNILDINNKYNNIIFMWLLFINTISFNIKNGC